MLSNPLVLLQVVTRSEKAGAAVGAFMTGPPENTLIHFMEGAE